MFSLLYPLLAISLAAPAFAQNPYANLTASPDNTTIPNYSPARPPAIPLAVRSPYTSAWSSTSGEGGLNTNGVMFWTGDPLGWEAVVTVDGISYEWMGVGSQGLPDLDNLKPARPMTVSYDSQYSIFTFQAGPIELTATFLSSVLPKDLCRTSIPLSYLSVSVRSLDGKAHDVQLYDAINGAWIASESNATLLWDLLQDDAPSNGTQNTTTSSSAIYTWQIGLAEPFLFGEEKDFPEWGNFTFSTTKGSAKNITYTSGQSIDVLYNYVNKKTMVDYVDANFRGWGVQEPVFAFIHDLGRVTSKPSSPVLYTLGSIQEPVIRYLTPDGIVNLDPWWKVCYGDMEAMIKFHYNDYATSQLLASQWESQLKADVDAYYASEGGPAVYSNAGPAPPPVYANYSTNQEGVEYIFNSDNGYGFLDAHNFTGVEVPDVQEAEAYYSIVAISARQIMGAYVLAKPPPTSCLLSQDAAHPLMFQKEISSDGNINTVDVMYPAMPFFLYANPSLLKYNLEPLFQNQEGNFYPNQYSMHDLGAHYPNATGHVEGNDEYMPVEESGNMIIMSYAYALFTTDGDGTSWLQKHYMLLKQFSSYLIDFSLLPGVQLSTDDFAGQLANQSNLAIKGIVGIAAMREISTLVGNAYDANNFSTISSSYISSWEEFAIDPSGTHTLLAYQQRSSYGLLYNIYPDKLLGLGIVPQYVYDMQSAWYPHISQMFGVPLDSRHDYTKSDWEMWTAATCGPSTRALFVTSLAYWMNETTTNLAFTDLYETTGSGAYPSDPDFYQFIARPVAGGHFSLLALGKEDSSATNRADTNSAMTPQKEHGRRKLHKE